MPAGRGVGGPLARRAPRTRSATAAAGTSRGPTQSAYQAARCPACAADGLGQRGVAGREDRRVVDQPAKQHRGRRRHGHNLSRSWARADGPGAGCYASSAGARPKVTALLTAAGARPTSSASGGAPSASLTVEKASRRATKSVIEKTCPSS